MFAAIYVSAVLRLRSLSQEAFELGQNAATHGDTASAHAHFRRAESLGPVAHLCCAAAAHEAREHLSAPSFRLEVEATHGRVQRELPDTMKPASAFWSAVAAIALLFFFRSVLVMAKTETEMKRHWWHPMVAAVLFVGSLYFA